jgi:O-acetyl-ADP-ribose deacetylase (regulator of RNase III)
MVDRLLKSDVVVVDITTLNANVLYELGIRHTAKRSGTVILRRENDPIPFNINGMRVISYLFNPTSGGGIDVDSDTYAKIIEASIRNSLIERNVDSLVHTLVPGLNVTRPARVIPSQRTFVWRWDSVPGREFCIVQGDLMNTYGIDVWVNPENTKMQMGRFHDNSISSCIRYYGAKRDGKGAVVTDTIVNELRRNVRANQMVEAGTVLVTRPGHLRRKNGVKLLCHVAAQHGEPGRGYVTIRSYIDCVANVLEKIDDLNLEWLRRLRISHRLKSVIFPLFGTRGHDRDSQHVADSIVLAAMNYLQSWPSSTIERVYFLAYTDTDDELVTTAFNRLKLSYVKTERSPTR